jgi:hypothetical protein
MFSKGQKLLWFKNHILDYFFEAFPQIAWLASPIVRN